MVVSSVQCDADHAFGSLYAIASGVFAKPDPLVVEAYSTPEAGSPSGLYWCGETEGHTNLFHESRLGFSPSRVGQPIGGVVVYPTTWVE